MEAFSLYETVA